VSALIEDAGARILCLPRYSPDFSPIEPGWWKFKELLRSLAARTSEALLNAVHFALSAISPSDARSWFEHCGHLVP
jgi:transposase